jgi:hypothetical protein
MPGSTGHSRKRPALDVDVAARSTLATQPVKRGLVAGLGEREAAREHARVAAGQLATVQPDRRDLGLRDAHLDPAADQARVQRVVVAVNVWRRSGGA